MDGFDVYYGCLRGTPYRGLDLETLCRQLLPRNRIQQIRYFTVRVSARASNPNAPQCQQAELRAGATTPGLTIHYGHFLAHPTGMLLPFQPQAP